MSTLFLMVFNELILNSCREFEEGKVDETKTAIPSAPTVEKKEDVKSQVAAAVTTVVKASIMSPLARFASNKPLEAPPPFEFSLGHPTGLSALDIDIIKLTAQFTVVNGREFLAGLAQREQRNPQFDFLKPTHMLFSYFTSLVDAYAKILQPTPTFRGRIEARRTRFGALEASVSRWEWARAEEERKRRESQEADAERTAFQAIDWYDFVVAETITFVEDELLEIAGLRIGGTYNEEMEMEMDTEVEPKRESAPPPPPPSRQPSSTQDTTSALSATDKQLDEDMDEADDDDDMDIRIVQDYKPRSVAPVKSVPTMIDPVSGKAVPASELSEHMRIQLMDPRWKEEQKRFQEKQAGTGYAAGSSIASSLKEFAKQRGDIFGSSEDEVAMMMAETERRNTRAEVMHYQMMNILINMITIYIYMILASHMGWPPGIRGCYPAS